MSWTLHLWVEGPTDAQTSSRFEPIPEPRGALPLLIWNTLRELSGKDEESFEALVPKVNIKATPMKDCFKRVSFSGGKRKDLDPTVLKMMIAFQGALADPESIIVAVKDEDGQEPPRKHREQIQEELQRTNQTRAAFGLCVRSVEAWLLADARAFEGCFGQRPGKQFPHAPEKDKDPKGTIRQLTEKLRAKDEGTAELFGRLAKHIDPQVLARVCPDGFGELRKDLERFVVPCLL